MREGQHEVLGKSIHQAERQLILMPLAERRIFLEILQGVVHPAHHPLHAEAQSPHEHRARHAGKGRRFLGDSLHVGKLLVGRFVHFAQQ